MSDKETQTVNIAELTKDIKELKKYIAEAMPQATPKGIVENKTDDEKEKPFRETLKQFLKSDHKTLEALKESIGATTTTSAKGTLKASPEILSPDGAEGYFLGSIVQWKDVVKGKPGAVVDVPTVAAVAAVTVASGTEPDPVAAAIASVPITLAQLGHGFYISKADMEDVVEGTVDALIEQSRKALQRAIDGYMLTSIQAKAGNAAAGTINEAGIMAATCLAKLWGSIAAGSYTASAIVMHPVQFASLLQDSQFTNAATFGDRTVIAEAKIPRYLGMDVVPLVQGTLLAATGGTYRAFMLAKGAIVGAIKRDIDVEKEYYVKDQRNYVMITVRFGGTVVHTSGIGLLTTVNG